MLSRKINNIDKILEYNQIACAVEKLHKSSAVCLTQQVKRATVTSKLYKAKIPSTTTSAQNGLEDSGVW